MSLNNPPYKMPTIVNCMKVGLVFMFFSCLAQLLGYAVPSWLYIELNTFGESDRLSYSYALWYATMCTNYECVTKSYFQLNKEYRQRDHSSDLISPGYRFEVLHLSFPFTRLVEFQIEATVALILGYLAFHTSRKQRNKYIHYFSGKRQDKPSPRRHCLIFCLALSSGILILVPFTQLANLNNHLHSLQDTTFEIHKVGAPYGLILSGIGGTLAILACVSMLFTLCCAQCDSNDESNGMYPAETGNGDYSEDSNNHVSIQLVPLAPSQVPSVQGYTDPAVPGYRPTWEHLNTQSGRNIHVDASNETSTVVTAGFIHDSNPGEETQFIPSSNNMSSSYEEPPPSYDEVMRYGNYPP